MKYTLEDSIRLICIMYFIGSSKPRLKDLQNIVVPKVTDKWRELGTELLRDSCLPKLDEIRENYPNDCHKCCLMMIDHWLKTTPSATWSDILQALRSPALELTANAEKIEMEIKGYLILRMYLIL